MKAEVIGKTIKYGKQTWRITSGHWQVMAFGTRGPEDNMIPRWYWLDVKEERVPDGVKEMNDADKI